MSEARRRLGGHREPHGCAHFLADGLCHVGNTVLVDVDDLGQQVDPLLARRLGIRLERRDRGGYRAVDILDAAQGDLSDDLLGRGIDHVEALAVDRVDPLAVDVELGFVRHG